MTQSTIWTEDRIALLTKEWRDGKSTSAIAGMLGAGISKNAVIGKIHRLGIVDRGDVRPARVRAERPKSDRPRKARLAPVAKLAAKRAVHLLDRAYDEAGDVVPMIPFVLPEAKGFGIEAIMGIDTKKSTCRWPVGDPRAADFRFCGADCAGEKSYCTHHQQLAYQPRRRSEVREVQYAEPLRRAG